MKRAEVLESAKEIVTKDRKDCYGSVEDNFGMIARLWSEYLDTTITSVDVASMMIMLKIARVKSGSGKSDNWVDIAGYAACGSEAEAMIRD